VPVPCAVCPGPWCGVCVCPGVLSCPVAYAATATAAVAAATAAATAITLATIFAQALAQTQTIATHAHKRHRHRHTVKSAGKMHFPAWSGANFDYRCFEMQRTAVTLLLIIQLGTHISVIYLKASRTDGAQTVAPNELRR